MAAALLGSVWVAADSGTTPAPERIGDAWTDPRNPIVRIFGGQRLDLWSLRPVAAVEPPARADGDRGASRRNPVDRFLESAAVARGLEPAAEADARALARRLSFDLTGLPPAPEEVEAFERECVPGGPAAAAAYERLVDRLLASPQYGEHQARLWLDVIRYSDSNGFDWDEFRPRAWQFRDYVIRSFNADKPFDRFIREQLAGDEWVEGPPRDADEQDALIATGYLRLGPHDNAAPLFNEQDRSRAELMADLVETTGSAFLGLTLSCCRCHHHKVDPLSQEDHYRMRAFFEPVAFADDLPLDLAADQDAIRRHNAALDTEAETLEAARERILEPVTRRLRAERIAALTPEEQALLEPAAEGQSSETKARVEALEKKVRPEDSAVKAALGAEEAGRIEDLQQQLAALKARRRPWTLGLLMTDREDAAAETRVLHQGDHTQPREVVAPGFLSALDPNPAPLTASRNPKTSGRRRTLADWIASPRNPLTARVLVNRLWQQHFGAGLVVTPNDFGLGGARPTHPELLDWLAGELVRGGWSVKRLQRLMVTSAAYRRQSAPRPVHAAARSPQTSDPGNTLLWRQNLRRLSAEQLRDALLATSGLLQFRTGGAPVWPELPPEILKANPAFLDDNETRTKGWYPSPADRQFVRSVYLVQKRTVRVPFLETFDLPENSTSCARRTESTVAPQALSLLNSPLAVEAAVAFSDRVRNAAGADPGRQIETAYRLALQRPPTPEERERCRRFLEERPLADLCRALLNLNEFAYVD
ncbi:MAG: DUF1553 domain-containing protein [Verrucomicrobiae bacterium]|nr:DUF1553 domain-containing protein [Verrucomicrobiae bacterium]